MESIYNTMREFLKKSGINGQENGSGRIFFSVNGLNFVFDANDADPHFLRLALPHINRKGVSIDNLDTQIQQLNRIYKVAKIVREQDGSLWIFADAFIYSMDNAESLFVRLIRALTDMVNDYHLLETNDTGTDSKK